MVVRIHADLPAPLRQQQVFPIPRRVALGHQPRIVTDDEIIIVGGSPITLLIFPTGTVAFPFRRLVGLHQPLLDQLSEGKSRLTHDIKQIASCSRFIEHPVEERVDRRAHDFHFHKRIFLLKLLGDLQRFSGDGVPNDSPFTPCGLN